MINLRDIIIKSIIKNFEGGLSNHKADRGGLTKYGITKPFLADFRRVKPAEITDDDIHNLTMAEATRAYQDLWKRARVDDLPEIIHHIYFDTCINSGIYNAVRILQEACKAGIDGKLGPHTRVCAFAMNEVLLLENFVAERIDFYEKICVADPTQAVFLNGWEARAKWFLNHRAVE